MTAAHITFAKDGYMGIYIPLYIFHLKCDINTLALAGLVYVPFC